MAGIYLHIPFCRQACHYCNFHFSTSINRVNDFIPALLREMELRRDYIGEETVDTVYFGGGTPSLLDTGALTGILDRLKALFRLHPEAEITLEANPDDIDGGGGVAGGVGAGLSIGGGMGAGAAGSGAASAKLAGWRAAGINRLSIGVQSFFEADLRWMNRAHDARQAIDSIRLAQKEGFANISIDLIYGGPTLPDSHWQANVEQAISLRLAHLSCYALTVEPKTALDKMIHMGKVTDVNPDDQARQFLLLMDWLAKAGYEHYEISNFALPGKRSRHNSSYWQGKPYLGLGPSAHSFNGVSRQWNVANNAKYIAALSGAAGKGGGLEASGSAWAGSGANGLVGGSPEASGLVENGSGFIAEKEELTAVQQLNEYIMISLRTAEGSSLSTVAKRFGAQQAEELWRRAERYMREGKIKSSPETLALTQEGKLLADGIAADLFFG
jgi:oxygen-independent coproporphyrinogen III oxidase